MNQLLHGVVCAPITPMSQSGEVDELSMRRLSNHIINSGISCLFPNGTNGESLSLTPAERRKAAEILVDETGNKATICIQCGALSPDETISHVIHSQQIGADAAGVMTPVFYHCDDNAIFIYYNEILSAVSDFPQYLYAIASRTGNSVSPSILGRLLANHKNLQGVKCSEPNLLLLQEYISMFTDTQRNACASRDVGQPEILIGCDRLALSCIAIGGIGWVSGPSAVFGKYHSKLYRNIQDNDFVSAASVQSVITDIDISLKGIPEVPMIKFMLKELGVIDCDVCRKPLRSLSDSEKRTASKILRTVLD